MTTQFTVKEDGQVIHYWPSNFDIEPDGTCVEKEFQADKTFALAERVAILTADTPGQAKRLGRQCTLRPDWQQVKINVMRGHVLRKFLDHAIYAEKLVATGDEPLAEHNWWHDNYWGVCVCDNCRDIAKDNNLGKILMEVRDLINTY